jgi:archaemetzincin
LRDYTKAFFHGMHVVLLPSGDWNNLNIKTYKKSYGIQLDSSEIMEKTFYKMPDDAYTYMNIVKDDLSRAGFGYVIGVSNFKSRTGVLSTARYDPDWIKTSSEEEEDDEDEPLDFDKLVRKQQQFNLLVFRSIKVLCHEIAHTFCLPHCPYYECLMNGSNTIIEGKRKPMYL